MWEHELPIQKATLAARRRGYPNVGVVVNCGKSQVVNVIYGKGGRSKIEPLSGLLDHNEVVPFLEGLK